MNSPLNKTDISWIVRQTVLGNAMFMGATLSLLWYHEPHLANLVFVALCSLIGLVSAITIIYSMIYKTLGEKVHFLYLILALIETASLLVLGIYMMMAHSS